ncbi:hypothetical protein Agabi119p4_11614 [Agaricus bisporus var. burnettii]|uniref:Uncharacterized protein n=1 Tax=Agaricus bisporus var. burnettii TaxID=192524 RepID=A0A8H7C1K6_AGABI|nr:hypothetical protein Agabi119p4_11614 [Agaricus bisporus var. burnettii]
MAYYCSVLDTSIKLRRKKRTWSLLSKALLKLKSFALDFDTVKLGSASGGDIRTLNTYNIKSSSTSRGFNTHHYNPNAQFLLFYSVDWIIKPSSNASNLIACGTWTIQIRDEAFHPCLPSSGRRRLSFHEIEDFVSNELSPREKERHKLMN